MAEYFLPYNYLRNYGCYRRISIGNGMFYILFGGMKKIGRFEKIFKTLKNMKKIEEKIIAIQTSLSLDLLINLRMQLSVNPEKTLFNFINDWQQSINWDKSENYSIVNQGVILTHLYGLIVYPKAIFHSDIPTIKLGDINKMEWGDFKFKSFPSTLNKKDKESFGVDTVRKDTEMTLEFLIRKIRNSIGHARVVIYENMDYQFNDEDGTEIYFNIYGLQKFTKKFQACYLTQNWQ